MTTEAPSLEQLLEQANTLFQQQDLARCNALYRQVVDNAIHPATRSAGLYGLGLVQLSRGADQDANSLLAQAFEQDHDNGNAAYYLAVLAGRRGDELAARRWYATTLVANPSHQGALSALASPGAAPPAPPAPSAPAGPTKAMLPPSPPTSPDTTIGIAQHVRQSLVPWRAKPASMTQLTFRVELYDHQGNGPLGTIGVELRGHDVHGVLEDGDWVELPRGHRLEDSKPVKELRNLSTRQRVYSKYRIFSAQ